MANNAVERRFGRHCDHRIDQTHVDVLALGHPVIEFGKHIARARDGRCLALDLNTVAARGDIDPETIFDRDQILIVLTEDAPEQLRLFVNDLQATLVAGLRGLSLASHA